MFTHTNIFTIKTTTMQRNKDISFGSQMKLDLHAVETIVSKLFDDIRDSNKEKLEYNITIKRRFEEKAITILQIRRINHEHTSELKKILAPVLYSLVKDAKPSSIFTRYSLH